MWHRLRRPLVATAALVGSGAALPALTQGAESHDPTLAALKERASTCIAGGMPPGEAEEVTADLFDLFELDSRILTVTKLKARLSVDSEEATPEERRWLKAALGPAAHTEYGYAVFREVWSIPQDSGAVPLSELLEEEVLPPLAWPPVHNEPTSYALVEVPVQSVTEASRSLLSIDGRVLEITIDQVQEGLFQPELAQVADAFARLPPELRNQVCSIHVKGKAKASSHSAADANAKGRVNIYPHRIYAGDAYLDTLETILGHEASHVWLLSAPELVPRWLKAMATDGVPVSEYSNNNVFDDAAEATSLYRRSRTTPLFDGYRALFPARFAMLDEVFGTTSPVVTWTMAPWD